MKLNRPQLKAIRNIYDLLNQAGRELQWFTVEEKEKLSSICELDIEQLFTMTHICIAQILANTSCTYIPEEYKDFDFDKYKTILATRITELSLRYNDE